MTQCSVIMTHLGVLRTADRYGSIVEIFFEGAERLCKSDIKGVFTVIDITGLFLSFIVPLDFALFLTDRRGTAGAPQMGGLGISLLFSPCLGETSLSLNSSYIDFCLMPLFLNDDDDVT